MVNLVTSLINIDREKNDGRKWEQYLDWFKETLKVQAPMIIFADQSLHDFILLHRNNLPTQMIPTSLNDIPCFNLKDDIDHIIDSSSYQEKIRDNNRIECQSSLYNIIMYSKFKWLLKASECNELNKNEYYFWLDAGSSRFYQDFDFAEDFPGPTTKSNLHRIGDKLMIQFNLTHYHDLIFKTFLDEDYLWDNRSFICGTFFGGNKKAINNINESIDDLVKYMIDNNCCNVDQVLLGFLFKNKTHLFYPYYKTSGCHIEMFKEFAK